MTPAEVLSKARDVLAERGWHQGDYHDATGRVCVAGAARAALTGDGTTGLREGQYGPYLEATRFLDLVVGGSCITWNDAPERTYEDVVLALKQAEELAVERGL